MASGAGDPDALVLRVCKVDCNCVTVTLAMLEGAPLGDEDPEADARDDPVPDDELVGDPVAATEGG